MTTHLRVEVIHRPCAFIIEISDVPETLKKLAMFFQDRHIVPDNLQLHRYRSGNAMVIIHCQLEKDRIHRTVELLEKLPGVLTLERMEGK